MWKFLSTFVMVFLMVWVLIGIEDDAGKTLFETIVDQARSTEPAKEPVTVQIPKGIDPTDQEYWELRFSRDISEYTEFVCAHGIPFIIFRGGLIPISDRRNIANDAWDHCRAVAKEKE